MKDTLDNIEEIQLMEQKYASFWQRFAAYVIDGAIITFVCSSLKWVIMDGLRFQSDFRMDYEESQSMAYFIWSFYLIFIRWSYFAGMESSPLKATFGKMIVGLYVEDESGNRINFAKASGRFFGKMLSGLLLMIGYIMAAFNSKKQALHDQMSGCVVLTK